ncbi:MAG: TlpA disulfide reductase family protein [Polaromonas sp.]|nr:TlpA disulfide reductase family protein [Polaromonas sp.]
MKKAIHTAPSLRVSQWFKAETGISPEHLKGKVVVIHAFQMLCPACVSHGVPQAIKIHDAFSRDDLVVLGLHSVFEHHDAMGPVALKAFLHEYRIPFPVGVDMPSTTGPVPETMAAYKLKGTPSLLVFDRRGQLRLNHFGLIDDLHLGIFLGGLVSEETVHIRPESSAGIEKADGMPENACDAEQCSAPV